MARAVNIDHQHYAEQGYIAIPQLLSHDEVEAARKALRAVMQKFLDDARAGRCGYRPPKPGKTGNYDGAWIYRADPKRVGHEVSLSFEHSYDPLSAKESDDAILARVRKASYYENEHPDIRALVDSPKVKGIAEELLGESAELFQTMALVKPALIGSEKPWHQDNAYFKYAPLDRVVGFWVALDDADKNNGCMHVLPGWHRKGGLKHFHSPGDCQILPDRVAPGEPLPIELKAGGAMFFSGMLPHQTPPNRSPKARRALQFHYRGVSSHVVDQQEYDRLFAEADGTPASCEAARR
jgi:phytanoyl-CoA hydroxylase